MFHALLPFVALKNTEVDTCIFCLSRDKIIICTAIMYFYILYLPGVLKTGLPEILSQVQHIAGNLLKLNLLKALILLV